jgi:hypothetical protein
MVRKYRLAPCGRAASLSSSLRLVAGRFNNHNPDDLPIGDGSDPASARSEVTNGAAQRVGWRGIIRSSVRNWEIAQLAAPHRPHSIYSEIIQALAHLPAHRQRRALIRPPVQRAAPATRHHSSFGVGRLPNLSAPIGPRNLFIILRHRTKHWHACRPIGGTVVSRQAAPATIFCNIKGLPAAMEETKQCHTAIQTAGLS